jgi:hypothetical protein
VWSAAAVKIVLARRAENCGGLDALPALAGNTPLMLFTLVNCTRDEQSVQVLSLLVCCSDTWSCPYLYRFVHINAPQRRVPECSDCRKDYGHSKGLRTLHGDVSS